MAKPKAKEAEAEAKEEAPKEEAEKKEGAEGEGGAEGAEGGEGAPKKSKKKLIIIGGVALLVIILGGVGAYFALSGGKHEEKPAAEANAEGKPAEKPVYYTLPEFLVNLNASGKQTSFLKTTIILEVPKQEDVALVEGNLPRILDAFNTYLRELRSSDLAGSAGIQRLREELLLRANKAMAPTKINDVLFKEIVVQ